MKRLFWTEVAEVFRDAGVPPVSLDLNGNWFVLPTRDWFAAALRAYQTVKPPYREPSWVCTEFTDDFINFARKRAAETSPDGRLAVGHFFYWPANPTGGRVFEELAFHSIACAVTGDGLVFGEPQTGALIELSENEKSSHMGTFM